MSSLPPHLNPAQRQAVLHPDGPLLILAGAGSGKTRVITHRLAELVRRGVPPERILAVTFTNKAAAELRERAAQLLQAQAEPLWVGTFHAICARLLRAHSARLGVPRNFAIASDADQLQVLAQVARELGLAGESGEPAVLRAAIEEARNQGQLPADLQKSDPLLARAYGLYERRLRERGALDFGDLLLGPLRLSREDEALREAFAARFDHVLVDEFQDVNPVQHQLLQLLAGRSRQLVVVGDDDQAIYGWRGADVRIILRFPSDWPDALTVRLEQNYRSTQLILDAANALIRRNQSRHDKTLFSDRRGGAPIVLHTARDERGEAQFVVETIARLLREEGRAPQDFAVCYRVHAQSRPLEEALRLAGLPFIKRRPQHAVPESEEEAEAEGPARGVALLTVHAAKGLEYPVVFVTGMEEGLFPSLWRGELDDSDEDPALRRHSAEARASVEEERRLCYVAITRARDRLYLCHARRRQLYGDYARDTEPSRFLDELPAACLVRDVAPSGAPWQKAPAPSPTKGGGFQVGQRVRHASFGEGEVRGVSGAGEQLKLAVYFDSAGPKTLLARFLTPL